MVERYPEGSVHGRFQPLHNEHMEYILSARERCDYLWVGITAFDLAEAQRARGTAREAPANNPLSYYERINIVRHALVDAGIEERTFGLIPFPIEAPGSLPNYLPTSVPCFTTICGDWNREKIVTLKRIGYTVIVLFERSTKGITGAEIRAQIVAGREGWRTLVPIATAKAIGELRLRERLLSLGGASGRGV